jgi:hypothetical protein
MNVTIPAAALAGPVPCMLHPHKTATHFVQLELTESSGSLPAGTVSNPDACCPVCVTAHHETAAASGTTVVHLSAPLPLFP